MKTLAEVRFRLMQNPAVREGYNARKAQLESQERELEERKAMSEEKPDAD